MVMMMWGHLRILATAVTWKVWGQPLSVSMLGKSPHVPVSLGLESGPQEGLILVWGSCVLLSVLALTS